MSRKNIEKMLARADYVDIREGMAAYQRYHDVMKEIGDRYGVPLERVIAAFCALSPNNDYIGNLRSLVSVLDGFNKGLPPDSIKVSTYKHCRNRALMYVAGERDFIATTTGPKIRNFYYNLLNPSDNRYVTIDGHMCAIWRGKNLTMKQAIVRGKREYDLIADTVKFIAFGMFVLPNQLQAILWFTRKRVFNIKFEPQQDIFFIGDAWRTRQKIEDLRPYT